MKTFYELQMALQTIGQQYKKSEEAYTAVLTDTTSTGEQIQAAEKTKNELKMRFDGIKQQHDALEAEQKAKLANQKGVGAIEDPQQKVTAAKAELYRNTIRKQPVSSEVKALLGDDTTGGNKFLPKTVSTQIITEPKVKNPLRGHSDYSQITNLEIPKLSFTIDDDDFIEDGETAKEMKLTGDTVQFGRHKTKIIAEVSETVINGTDTALVSEVDKGLESGVAAKERKVAFAKTPKVGEEHMSFYRTGTPSYLAIKSVSGADLYESITNAIADLHEDYRENAKVFMKFSDYLKIVKTLANGSATLYSAQPEQIIGKPVVFTDAAVKPVIGDFSYSHFNYDLNALYDTDKNVKTGMHQFVVTAYFDHQIKLASAFRIADVTPVP
ncbi:phage major capsid protein [Viridibacillus sp. FSL R5-0468]|uniref:phage major capsid protein n=1 Tax=Viridibacillus sp. FSL R5-0468 TaxID=2921640 RepID=UPI0030F50C37